MNRVEEVKELIIDSLNLPDMKPADIADDCVLFSEDGLGLDSVDALELALALQKKYGLNFDTKTADVKNIFATPSTLAEYIEKNKGA